MANTIRDVQDSIMKGKSIYSNWKEQFEKDFRQPDKELEFAKFWESLPAVVKEWYKKEKPDIYKEMNRKYGGG